jgi:DNA-binding winged helix-turn-helix (wHTH) protein
LTYCTKQQLRKAYKIFLTLLFSLCYDLGKNRRQKSYKDFWVPAYLVTHPDRLVTKDALLDAVWPELAISDAVVRIAIGELRRALGDTAQASRFIATVHRRGYRFVVPVVEHLEGVPEPASPVLPTIPPPAVPHSAPVAPATCSGASTNISFPALPGRKASGVANSTPPARSCAFWSKCWSRRRCLKRVDLH